MPPHRSLGVNVHLPPVSLWSLYPSTIFSLDAFPPCMAKSSLPEWSSIHFYSIVSIGDGFGLLVFFSFYLGIVLFSFSLYSDLQLYVVLYLRVIENIYITVMRCPGGIRCFCSFKRWRTKMGDYMGVAEQKRHSAL